MFADERHLTPDQVAGYLAGAIAPAERADLARHLEGCADCRHELIEVGGMVADYRPAGRAAAVVRWRRRLIPVGMALAAGVAAIAVYRRLGRADEAVVRAEETPGTGEGVPVIAVVSPSDGAEVRDSVVLRWRAAGQDSYRVFVLSGDGRPLWTTRTTDTVARVPATIPLERGATYFWRVDAIGNGIVASTGVRRLTVFW